LSRTWRVTVAVVTPAPVAVSVNGCGPSAAVSSTMVSVKFAESWPAGMVTVAGTVAWVGSLEVSVTVRLVASVLLSATVAAIGASPSRSVAGTVRASAGGGVMLKPLLPPVTAPAVAVRRRLLPPIGTASTPDHVPLVSETVAGVVGTGAPPVVAEVLTALAMMRSIGVPSVKKSDPITMTRPAPTARLKTTGLLSAVDCSDTTPLMPV
jgi:hypothetical protein